MKPAYKRALLALLFGAWLPVVISCDPGYLDGLIQVVDDGWSDNVVVVDDGCHGCWWGDCCWW